MTILDRLTGATTLGERRDLWTAGIQGTQRPLASLVRNPQRPDILLIRSTAR